jgi:hypothetical protein
VCPETFSCALEDNLRRLDGGRGCSASGVAVIEERKRN